MAKDQVETVKPPGKISLGEGMVKDLAETARIRGRPTSRGQAMAKDLVEMERIRGRASLEEATENRLEVSSISIQNATEIEGEGSTNSTMQLPFSVPEFY